MPKLGAKKVTNVTIAAMNPKRMRKCNEISAGAKLRVALIGIPILADFAGALLTSLESAFSNEGTSIAHVGEE